MHEAMDWIQVHGLVVKAQIGVHAWEQRIQQTLLIDIACALALPAQVSLLSETLDYAALSALVTQRVQAGPFQLIEAVASEVIESILAQFQDVKSVKVTVTKPLAIANAKGVSVTRHGERPH